MQFHVTMPEKTPANLDKNQTYFDNALKWTRIDEQISENHLFISKIVKQLQLFKNISLFAYLFQIVTFLLELTTYLFQNCYLLFPNIHHRLPQTASLS